MANGFNKDYNIAHKLAIRVAIRASYTSDQRTSTIKVLCLSAFTIDGHEFTNLQFRVLPHFKSSDIILGLPALKRLGVVVHPSLNTFTMGKFKIICNRESRRISGMIVDFDKIDKIIVKQTQNMKNPSDVFLLSLHFAEDLASVISDFGEQLDQQLKRYITLLADVT